MNIKFYFKFNSTLGGIWLNKYLEIRIIDSDEKFEIENSEKLKNFDFEIKLKFRIQKG